MRLLVAIACLLLAAHAAEAAYIHRSAIAGKPIRLIFLFFVNPDCSSRELPTVRITQNPQHGRVQVSKTQDFPTYPESNSRSVCNSRRVDGIAVSYVAEPGYLGGDYVGMEAIYDSGFELKQYYYITVK